MSPRLSKRLLALAVTSVGFTAGISRFSASAAEMPALSEREQLVIDDDGIVNRLETVGGALVREGKVPKVKALRSDLGKRAKCSLSLPQTDSSVPMQPNELYERRASGVLVVGMLGKRRKSNKYEVAGCSGFALTDDGIFVTNYHVVDDPAAEGIVVMTREGIITPATEVLAADKLKDVAILRAKGAKFQPLPLATLDPLPGSSIWAISHPDHNFFCLTAGTISRYFIANTEAGRTPQMAITADFGIGSSGGPILTARGEVAGMVCATTSVYYTDAKAKINDLQMVFKHCVPTASIRSLIDAPAP